MLHRISKLAYLAVLLGSASLLAASPAAGAAVSKPALPESTLILSGTWQFALGKTEKEVQRLAGFHQKGFDATAFRPIKVPSNWALQGFEEPHYKLFKDSASEGFYLHHFKIPESWSNQRVVLHFAGVWSSAEMWLNDSYLGRQDSGFTKISVDVTSQLRTGADNVLAVRVRQTQPDYALDTNDDWSLGGIYRDVTLEAMPKQRYLDRVQVETVFDQDFRDADLKIRLMVVDHNKRLPPGNYMYPGGESYALRFTLRDAKGVHVESQELAVEAHYGTGRETAVSLHVKAPLHWTAETPDLYKLSVELLESSKVAQRRELDVGFRQISTVGGVLRVNGQAVKLRGVNRHDENPDVGRATTPDQWLEDIKLMKAANINYIRAAHYPPSEGFLGLCDRLGMYVSDEISMGYGGEYLDNPIYAGAAMLRTQATVVRDINHPSVIIWAVGNEDPVTSVHLDAVRAVKAIDPTRPVLMPWHAETWLPPEIDILSAHYFTAAKYDELASKANRPIVTTEFTHAFGNDGFGGMDERWKALTQHPSGAGGAVWMWADQGIHKLHKQTDGTFAQVLEVIPDGFDGITDSYRKPTRDYWEAKAVYAPVYPTVDTITVVPGQLKVRVPVRNDFDFTDLGAISLQWALMEDDKQLSKGRVALSGAPHATSWAEVPSEGLKHFEAGKSYFYHLIFQRADGGEITRRAVELRDGLSHPVNRAVADRLLVEKQGLVSVSVGAVAYRFDPNSGGLVSATVDGTSRVVSARPTIWRPMNESENIIINSERGQLNLPDLNRCQVRVLKWNVDEEATAVRIQSEVEYRIDDSNRFSVAYDYSVDRTGALDVLYRVLPEVQAKWLPFIGVEIELAPQLQTLKWLGLGPLDAYPNEKLAPILGVWSQALGVAGAQGMKATRWAHISNGGGEAVRIEQAGFLSYDSAQPSTVRVLSSVLGRPTKVWRPEDESYRLDTGAGKTFFGQFRLRLE